MPVLPGSLALTVINDGAPIVASDHRNNYTSIQGAVNSLIGILDNGNSIDGDPLVWDATLAKWSAASRLAAGRARPPRVVTSTLAGGPPASPLDGDIWIATAVDANGTVWQFRYNAGSASAYKWEFIGGSPAFLAGAVFSMSVVAAFTTTGLTFTTARAGEYLCVGEIFGSAAAVVTDSYLGVGVNGVASVSIGGCSNGGAAAHEIGMVGQSVYTATAAGTLTLCYYTSAAWVAAGSTPTLAITPRRVA